MPNAWITHVKQFASQHKMKYGVALKQPQCKSTYHSKSTGGMIPVRPSRSIYSRLFGRSRGRQIQPDGDPIHEYNVRTVPVPDTHIIPQAEEVVNYSHAYNAIPQADTVSQIEIRNRLSLLKNQKNVLNSEIQSMKVRLEEFPNSYVTRSHLNVLERRVRYLMEEEFELYQALYDFELTEPRAKLVEVADDPLPINHFTIPYANAVSEEEAANNITGRGIRRRKVRVKGNKYIYL